MGSATSLFENYVLDAILGSNHGPAIPATVYIGLYTSAPDDGGGGTEVTTIGTAYSRVAVTNNTVNWPAALAGVKQNGTSIQFAMASDFWGTISWFGIFDASTGGNLLVWGEVTTAITPEAGNSPFFAPNSLAVTCD